MPQHGKQHPSINTRRHMSGLQCRTPTCFGCAHPFAANGLQPSCGGQIRRGRSRRKERVCFLITIRFGLDMAAIVAACRFFIFRKRVSTLCNVQTAMLLLGVMLFTQYEWKEKTGIAWRRPTETIIHYRPSAGKRCGGKNKTRMAW